MQAELFFSLFSVFKVLLLNISKTYSDFSKWPNNSMQFSLGMPFFLGVLGTFYRNRKGLNISRLTGCVPKPSELPSEIKWNLLSGWFETLLIASLCIVWKALHRHGSHLILVYLLDVCVFKLSTLYFTKLKIHRAKQILGTFIKYWLFK